MVIFNVNQIHNVPLIDATKLSGLIVLSDVARSCSSTIVYAPNSITTSTNITCAANNACYHREIFLE